ncbi:hypothetical protein V1477_007102 [Vespula maculifrons]|uniref:Uncharacterized protein n=1 Tax=Vespula maculifrons TaxID=7453 RepID=A0ABD2CHK9_VESMC
MIIQVQLIEQKFQYSFLSLRRYQRCPRSFSLAIKVSTSGTIAPACLTGGSSTEIISILADVSMPRSFELIFLIGFFFAFIIFGNVAYRGSLRRRSALRTAGVFNLRTSNPPSISRMIIINIRK